MQFVERTNISSKTTRTQAHMSEQVSELARVYKCFCAATCTNTCITERYLGFLLRQGAECFPLKVQDTLVTQIQKRLADEDIHVSKVTGDYI